MKVKLNPLVKVAASALLTTVIFIVVLTLSIGGYMTYVLQQARLGSRSQAWNMAMAVSEAGIEEGFEYLNDDTGALGSDGWSSAGGGVYSVTRTLNGTFASTYTVVVNDANPAQPTITSSAYVKPPAAAQNTPPPFFYAAVGVNQTSQSAATASVGRGIQAILTKPTFFNAAMVAKGNIDMHGNNVTVDSFDSAIAGENVNGQWNSSISGNDGIVASDGGITNSVSIGNANIYGQLYTGAGESDTVGANGFVGTHAWVSAGGSGIEPGYAHTDANYDFPNTSLPANYTSYPAPQSGDIVTVSATNTVATTNVNMASYPTGLTNGQALSAVTTNTTLTTVSVYPGALSGLTSNTVYETVSSYPGSQPGLVTNCLNSVTTATNPGQQPCLSQVTTTTNVASIPNPPPSGLATNTTPTSSSTYPSPGTYAGNVSTNTTPVSDSTTPPTPGDYQGNVSTNSEAVNNASSPPAAGTYSGAVTTNTTAISGAGSYPSAGTFVPGSVTTNYNGGGKIKGYNYTEITGYNYNEKDYSYNQISDYSYNQISSYSYPVTLYTYSTQLSYTYQAWSYTYPIQTYSYVLYSSGYTYTTNNYDAVLSSGNYQATSLGNTVITGPVTLVMPNGYNINNLTIAPGGSLTIYLGGNNFSIGGNGTLNQPGLAQNLIIYCAPSVTSFSLSGNAGLDAVIVAPNANVQLNGGGNNTLDFSGSLMANSITLNGHWNFHYDVALSQVPSPGRYILSSWQEIPVPPQ